MFLLNFDIYCPTVQPSRFRWDSPDLARKQIPNPYQSAIRIGKILIFSYMFRYFQMDSYDTYRKTPNGVYFTETDVQKTAKKTT